MRERDFPEIGRWVSIFDRLMKMYYDRSLSGYDIGWGQQFYVEYLWEHPGATSQEMAERFRVDKATLTKMIKKLTEVGYIRVSSDAHDRRVKHLYLTEEAVPAARRIRRIFVPKARIRNTSSRRDSGTRATASEMPKDTSTKNRMWLV